ncbi:hypothetical protein MASR2M117_02870 [Paludibacter sp.]
MKKAISTLVLLFVIFLSVNAQTIVVGDVTYNIDTLENHQVGPGTIYTALTLTAPSKRLDVFFLKTDITNPYIEIRATIGRDSIYSGEPISSVAKRKTKEGAFYFAGTNGDFYDTALPYVGYPVSGNMIDGEIAKIPTTSRNVFVMDALKKPDIGKVSFAGKIKFGEQTQAINSVNHLRAENALVLYNQLNGKYTRTNAYGTEVLVELINNDTWGTNKTLYAKVLKIEKDKGSMAIPQGKAVLSGHGTSRAFLDQLSVNDEIEIKFDLKLNNSIVSNFIQMTGGDNYATMLLNGVVEQTNIWNERHPRTGLGYSQKKDKIIFCVVDGRGVSMGATTKELAELMKSAGAYTAFNMDGGGSSTMYVSEYGKAVNRTSDGNERAVANGIFAVSTAPTDNVISIIKPYKSSISLPQFGEYIPKFYGYNQYGVLLSNDVKNVVLTCSASLGIVDGNRFVATGTTAGNITATHNGVATTTIAVDLQAVSKLQIKLDSVIVDNRSDYPIEVIATTAGGDALISPDALSWTVANPEICSIVNGKVKALKNGKTIVEGKIGAVTDEILIKVEIPEKATIIGDDMNLNNWNLSASSFLNAQLNQSNIPAGWSHGAVVNFTNNAGRAPYITLTNKKDFFGLPDTVRFVMNTGEMEISRAIFSLKANNSSKTVSYELNIFVKNADFNLDIPLEKIFDITDKATFPVSFDNVKFYIDNTSMTNGQAYSLAVKEVQLAFSKYLETGLINKQDIQFSIYPNPAQDIIYIKTNQTESPLLQLYSLSGVLLKSIQANQMDISEFANGSYLLQVQTKEGRKGKMVMVNR